MPASSGEPHIDPAPSAAAAAPDRLDDPEYPAFTTGRAAEVLGVQQAFLRALDAAGALTPVRSEGGHRRYTRRQLAFARRIRELFDQGHNLGSSLRILALQDELAAEQALVAGLRDQLRRQDHQQGRNGDPGPAGKHPGDEAAGAGRPQT